MSVIKQNRRWGTWEVLVKGELYKVKLLTVEPNKSLSLQSHKHRLEHWQVLEGIGLVKLGEDQTPKNLSPGDCVVIPVGIMHKLYAGEHGIKILEVQRGSILEETDIERFD